MCPPLTVTFFCADRSELEKKFRLLPECMAKWCGRSTEQMYALAAFRREIRLLVRSMPETVTQWLQKFPRVAHRFNVGSRTFDASQCGRCPAPP